MGERKKKKNKHKTTTTATKEHEQTNTRWLFSWSNHGNRMRSGKTRRAGRDEITEATYQQTSQFLLIVCSMGKVSLPPRGNSHSNFWTTGNTPCQNHDITQSQCGGKLQERLSSNLHNFHKLLSASSQRLAMNDLFS